MDEASYNEIQHKKFLEHEALCNRCGACCGALEEDPCEYLKRDFKSIYFCDIYEERFGLRKTVGGEPILCTPIRNVLHKTWWGRSGCIYVKKGRA